MDHRNLKIALIADELTRTCLKYECKVMDVTPLNYRFVLSLWRPDMLFVESAWQGRRNSWKYKIAAYPERPERTNDALRKVVAYARDIGIPCVFWNKEDGVHFERFIASAALFDYIFTVDVNCVDTYKSEIIRPVVVTTLPFAVQPKIHHPEASGYKYKRACFVGSYSHHIHELRRQRQDMLFAASSEIGLTIFDRNSNRASRNYRYPDLPGLEIRKSVAYDQTAQIYRDYMISLNVNTMEDSPTMFSRRLIEILGCGGMAITTPSDSVDKYFKDYCYVVKTEHEARELFRRLKDGLGKRELEMTRAGAEYVLNNHTWAHRLNIILTVIS